MSASLPEDLHEFDGLMRRNGYFWKRQSGSHKQYENHHGQVVTITAKGHKVEPEHVRASLKQMQDNKRQLAGMNANRIEGEGQEVGVPEIRKRVLEQVAQKQCSDCQRILPVNCFSASTITPDKLKKQCKDCQRERDRYRKLSPAVEAMLQEIYVPGMDATTLSDVGHVYKTIAREYIEKVTAKPAPKVKLPKRPARESVKEQARAGWKPGMSLSELMRATGISLAAASKYRAVFEAEEQQKAAMHIRAIVAENPEIDTSALAAQADVSESTAAIHLGIISTESNPADTPNVTAVHDIHMSLAEWLATPDYPAVFITSRFSIIAMHGDENQRVYYLCTADISGPREPIPVSLLPWAIRLANPDTKPEEVNGVVHQ